MINLGNDGESKRLISGKVTLLGGTLGTDGYVINHNLGYSPAAFVFMGASNTTYVVELPISSSNDSSSLFSNMSGSFSINSTSLTIIGFSGSTTPEIAANTVYFYYIIFPDRSA